MVDYSKWKEIEISDDEDDTHPNIDTPSLFRWRHQARIDRMEQHKAEVDTLAKKKAELQKRRVEIESGVGDPSDIQQKLSLLQIEQTELEKQENEIRLKEKKMPWNVDTISKEKFAKTVINKQPERKKEELTEEEKEIKMKQFIKDNEADLKKFGMLKRYDDSKAFLRDRPHLVSEYTANYLVIWCIDLAIEEKFDLMDHVSHQVICMQYILESSKQLDIDPRACVPAFFSRIQVAEPDYKLAFDDELKQFKQRIRKRAIEKIEALTKEIEEEERQKRLGPGGLDPIEVYESLPEDLKKCFDSKDVAMLQETIAKMPEEQMSYHMKRCIDSGLWIPDAKKGDDDASDGGDGGDGDDKGEGECKDGTSDDKNVDNSGPVTATE